MIAIFKRKKGEKQPLEPSDLYKGEKEVLITEHLKEVSNVIDDLKVGYLMRPGRDGRLYRSMLDAAIRSLQRARQLVEEVRPGRERSEE